MKKIILLILSLGMLGLSCEAKIKIEDFVDADNKLDWKIYEREVFISQGISFHAKIVITSKGNGSMKIANLKMLKVYDDHMDGNVYENGLFDIDFIDLNADRYKDMVISGNVIYTDEKDEKTIFIEPVVFIYLFFPEKKKFVLSYRNASFSLDKHDAISGLGNEETVNLIQSKRKEALKENLIDFRGK